MSKWDDIYERVMDERGRFDRLIRFDDLTGLLYRCGARWRKRGSHVNFYYEGSLVNSLQPLKNGMAKPYQVAQVREKIKLMNLNPSR